MSRGKIALIPIVIAGLVMLFQYFGAEKVKNPETGKSYRVALSSEQEQKLGLQSYQEVLAQSQVVERGPEHDLVVKVAERLAAATGDDAKDFKWQVSLVNSSQQNAFCLPGGKIVVYTGILPTTKNEAGLATVMGHEMSHAIARHGSQRLLRSSLAQTLLTGANFSMSNMDPGQRQGVMAALGAGAQYGVLLPFSRDHESEADKMGLIYMARAGYDPREAISFWERMSQSGGGQPPEFMSTHPSHGSRIDQLRAQMPKAVAEYEKKSAR
ncbi:MAG: M48 family metallopeptidase [Verrucomicrobiota bacterium]|nr:M48 family metallopeptidase [Verrucomicrobiota bacterium]